MKMIKKDGRLEEFKSEKIRTSVLNASNEVNQPMLEVDLNVVEKEVINTLEELKREVTSSYEIFGIVLHVLKALKFNEVGKSYLKGSVNF